MMKLMYLTADPEAATQAIEAGVDRVFVDLEYIKKAERQRGRNTLISHNTIDDVHRVRAVVPEGQLLVRINPINPATDSEVDEVLSAGADIVMVPMVMDADDVRRFVESVAGRAHTCVLYETAQSLVRMDAMLDVPGVDEVYIGLNDLHISMALDFMFELLSGGVIDYMAAKVTSRGIPFGFGGVARIGEGTLPAEVILGEHYRLGSSSVILSRTFRGEVGLHSGPVDLCAEIARLRAREEEISGWSEADFETNRAVVRRQVAQIVSGA
jgi:hypothetical protein